MRFSDTARLLILAVSLVILVTTLILFLELVRAWSAPPPAPPPSSQVPDRVSPYTDLTANKPVIFFEEDTQILVVYPNGDIIHRGRKVTTDREVVGALQEIVRLSPCLQEKGPEQKGAE